MITFIFVKINLCCIGIVLLLLMTQFSSVQSLSCVQFFATPWIMARQASLSITNSRSSLRLTSIESVMPSSHLILCRLLLLLPPIPPSIRVFSNESWKFCTLFYVLGYVPVSLSLQSMGPWVEFVFLLLYENCINLYYVEFVHSAFHVYYILLLILLYPLY